MRGVYIENFVIEFCETTVRARQSFLGFENDKGDAISQLVCSLLTYLLTSLSSSKNDQPLHFSRSIGSHPDALDRLLQQAGIPLADDSNALRKSYGDEAALVLQRAGEGDAQAQELIGKYLISGLDQSSRLPLVAGHSYISVKYLQILQNSCDMREI